MATTGRPQITVAENFFPLNPSGQSIPGEALPCIAGVYPRGPLRPTLVSSWSQYVALYGDFTVNPGNLFPFAVYQFFNNGGAQLYVSRLANTDAVSASQGLSDIETASPRTDVAAAPRTDTGCAIGALTSPYTVTDPAAVAGDVGGTITCAAHISGGTTIASVTPGVGYTLNQAPSATGSGLSFVVTQVPLATTASSTTVVDPFAITADLGATITCTTDGKIPANTTIASVTPGVGYTLSQAATASGTALSFVVTDAAPDVDYIIATANSPGVWANSVYLEVTSAGSPGRSNVNVYYQGTAASNLVETFQDVSTNPADRRYLINLINSPIAGSNFISMAKSGDDRAYQLGVTDLALQAPTAMASGSDGSTPPTISTAVATQLDTLINQALYVNIPGVDDAVNITALNSWATGRGDIMLVVDGPPPNLPETTATVTANYLSLVQGSNSYPASTYITVYAPWLLISDPSSTVPGAVAWVPPGGAVLGQWNSSDILYGTVQTPAGIQTSVDCVDLEARFSNAQLDTLNNAQINVIKLIPGIGFTIFGGRTLHPAFPDRYIAVRRMALKLEHDFKWILLYALFRPNDAALWLSITGTLQNYLNQLFQAGQLGGTSTADAFSVVCDQSINTEATASAGIVNVNVAVALLSPAEYINITLSLLQPTGTISATTQTT